MKLNKPRTYIVVLDQGCEIKLTHSQTTVNILAGRTRSKQRNIENFEKKRPVDIVNDHSLSSSIRSNPFDTKNQYKLCAKSAKNSLYLNLKSIIFQQRI